MTKGNSILDVNPPGTQSKVWHLPVHIMAGLLVFASTMTLLNKTDPVTAQEEMETENLVKWALSNLGGAATMHAFASFQRDIWPMITTYLSQKRNKSLILNEDDSEDSIKSIRENIQKFIKDWFLNGAAAFGGFTNFSMVSTCLNLLDYGPDALAVTRGINALGTTGILCFLHSLTGASIPVQQMLQLSTALFTVEYSGDIATEFTSLLGETLSETQMEWFNIVFANAVTPAAISLVTGFAYSAVCRATSSVIGFFRSSVENSIHEKTHLLPDGDGNDIHTEMNTVKRYPAGPSK